MFSVGDTEWVAFGVADGVGSAEYSHRGSAAALQALVEELSATNPEDMVGLRWPQAAQAIVERISDKLRALAVAESLDEKSLSTTLLAVVLPLRATDAQPTRPAAYLTVGDGGILRLAGGEWQTLAGEGPNSDTSTLHSTLTTALPSTTPAVQAATFLVRAGEVVVAATDGFTGLLAVPEARDFFAQRWSSARPQLPELAWQLEARVKTYDDDRSIAAWWEGSGDFRAV